jgi:hypothetical protein
MIGGAFLQNELILEFQTKSMLSRFRVAAILDLRLPVWRTGKKRRHDPWDCHARVGKG